ncbi:hypothetical protein Acsp03_48430 [Actinomadura sp. NBRC 104412]|nr:hypothetical protein Acsp03_48430 [Actinomadura sp. NBRC 104412]
MGGDPPRPTVWGATPHTPRCGEGRGPALAGLAPGRGLRRSGAPPPTPLARGSAPCTPGKGLRPLRCWELLTGITHVGKPESWLPCPSFRPAEVCRQCHCGGASHDHSPEMRFRGGGEIGELAVM